MKIRTDFVTNSSSSSFVVEITATGKNGESIFYCSPDEDSDVNMKCSASGILASKTIEELCEMLSTSFYDGRGDNTDDRLKTAPFIRELKEKIKTLDGLAELTLKRKLSAWGEGANAFVYTDCISYVEFTDFWELIESVAYPEESSIDQTDALKRLIEGDYESFFIGGHTSHKFPENFLETNPKLYIDMSQLSKDVVKAANMVAEKQICTLVESGEEEVVIDFQAKKISSSAVYHLQPSDYLDNV